MKFEDVQQMTLEQSLTKVATYLRQGNKYDANLLLKVLDKDIEVLTCNLSDEKCNYKGAYSTIVAIKNKENNTFYTAENCQFVYKRSVKGKMLPIGIVELVAGTIAFLVEDFASLVSMESLVSTKSITLYYPEFYRSKNTNTVSLDANYTYSSSNYEEVEIANFINRKEIEVEGEGKDSYVIGVAHTVEMGDKNFYLYETKGEQKHGI